MSNPFFDAIRKHPEVVKAAEDLEHAIMRAAEAAVIEILKGALPFPFSLAAPLAAPLVDKVEKIAEGAIDGVLDRLAAPAVPGQVAAPAPALPAAAMQAAGTQGWRNLKRAAESVAPAEEVEPEAAQPIDAGSSGA